MAENLFQVLDGIEASGQTSRLHYVLRTGGYAAVSNAIADMQEERAVSLARELADAEARAKGLSIPRPVNLSLADGTASLDAAAAGPFGAAGNDPRAPAVSEPTAPSSADPATPPA
jgi:hypothetical protein